MIDATLTSATEGHRAKRAARDRRASFLRGWRDAERFRLGLGPEHFGCGPRRDRDYADGWKSSHALTRALRVRR